jgi:hypothetical protein
VFDLLDLLRIDKRKEIMSDKKKQKKNKSPKPDFTPDIYYSGGHWDQIQDSLSMEFGRDRTREIMSKW